MGYLRCLTPVRTQILIPFVLPSFYKFVYFVFALSVIGLPWRVSSIQCKVGWQEWNQACYKVSTEQTSFSNALASCKQDGANLASIHNAQENEFVRTLPGGKDVFIGFSDTKIEGTFSWSDGSTSSYNNWEDGEPDDASGLEDCVILTGKGKWNDTPCIMWCNYVCKFTVALGNKGQGILD